MRSTSAKKDNTDIPQIPKVKWFGVARIAPWMMLVFCLALSWLLWNAAQQEAKSKLQENFDFRVRQAVSLTDQRILAQEQILRGARGLFAASVSVERNEFRDYVATLKLDENYPGIQGVGYAQIVPRAEISKHIEAVRNESGHPEYLIRPEGKRDFYTSIVYLEPFSGRNLRAFGYDMYSEPVRRAAMEQARDTGMASLSGKVLLVQETDQHPQSGFLIYLPVYRNGAPHKTVQERRANIIGWVYSPFRMDDLAQGMYGERAKDLDIEIYDGEKIVPDALMYDSNRDHKARFQDLSSVQRLNMKSHIWTLSIHSTPLFLSREEHNESSIVAFVGIGFSLLFAVLTWLLVTGRERAIPYAQEMNRELILKEQALRESGTLLENIIENIPNMIFLKRAKDLRFELVNRAGEVILGHSREEIIGKDPYVLFPKEQADFVAKNDREVLQQSGVVDIPEVSVSTPHGIRFLHTKKLTLRDAHGQPTYLLGISEDITERKRVNEALLKSRKLTQSVIENVPIRVFWKDRDLRYLGCNILFAQDAGYTKPEELIGKTDFEMGWKDQAELYRADDQAVMDSGNPKLNYEEPQTTPDGNTIWLRTSKVPMHDEHNQSIGILGIYEDITKRKLTEISLIKSNRALAALSSVNHSLVHSDNEPELLSAVCQAIVRQSSYRMVWVGYLEQDEAKTVRVVAHDGIDEGYPERAMITWADTEHGRGPTGTAARSGQTQVIQNFLTDERVLPWLAEASKRGLASGISLPLSDAGKVFGVLTIYSGYIDAFGEEEVSLLEQMAGDLAFGILSLRTRNERDEAQNKIKKQLSQLESNLEDTIKAITTIVEMRDPYTAGHEARVSELATAIAREMGLPDEQVHGIHLAGEVHDLGKIQVPAEILSMPRRLTEIEYGLIKNHPQAGYDILKDIDFPWPIAQMVLQHHERMDGSGYPQGLKGEAILIEARILCVADVVEAMSSHRPYRPGLGIDAALNEIKKGSGAIYDSTVVSACLKLFQEGHFKFGN